MKIKGIVAAAVAVTLSLTACTVSSAFTTAAFDGQFKTTVQKIVTDAQAGVVGTDEMLARIEDMIARIDDRLDAGAENEVELLEARGQLVDARAQLVGKSGTQGEQLVQITQDPMNSPGSNPAGQGMPGGGGSSFSGGGGGGSVGGGSIGGASGAGGSIGGVASLAAVGGVVGTTTRNNRSLPAGLGASNSTP